MNRPRDAAVACSIAHRLDPKAAGITKQWHRCLRVADQVDRTVRTTPPARWRSAPCPRFVVATSPLTPGCRGAYQITIESSEHWAQVFKHIQGAGAPSSAAVFSMPPVVMITTCAHLCGFAWRACRQALAVGCAGPLLERVRAAGAVRGVPQVYGGRVGVFERWCVARGTLHPVLCRTCGWSLSCM